MADTNNCPHPTCNMRIPKNQYACTEHWTELPEGLRNDIWKGKRSDPALHAETDKKIKDYWAKGEG